MIGSIDCPVKMVFDCCCVCGVPFAMPEELDKRRRDNSKTFYCPNGHRLHYPKKRERKSGKVSRDEHLRAVHRAEQAEAKAAELAAQETPIQPICRGDGSAQERFREGDLKAGCKKGEFACPICLKKYKTTPRCGNHIEAKHGLDRCTLQPINRAKQTA